jgi:hypothetical protein
MSTLNGGPGNIVTNGLVFYVDAGNYASYTSGSLVWNDLTNSGYSGSLINNVGYNSSNVGTLTFISGSGSFVRITSNANFAPISQDSQSFSVSCWIKGAVQVGQNMVVGQDWGSTGNGWNGLRFRQDTIQMCVGNNVLGQNASAYVPNLLSTTAYKLYTGTYDGSQVVLYINGVSASVASITTYYPQLNNTGKSWTIGGNYQRTSPADASFFEGNIGSVSFYNRALTAQEVLQNYNTHKNRFDL